jgi:tetratricopeptide (TPR) repeat protein
LEAVREELSEWTKSLPSATSAHQQLDRVYQATGTIAGSHFTDDEILNSPLAKLPDSVQRSIRSMRSKLTTPDLQALSDQEKLKGNESLRAGDLKDAVRFYTKSLYLFPQPHLFTNRALAYLKLKHYGHVIQDCTNGLRMNCDQPKAYYRRALAHRALKAFSAAMDDLRSVMELDAGHEEAGKVLKELEQQQQEQQGSALCEVEDEKPAAAQKIPIVEADSDSDAPDNNEEDDDDDEFISSDEDEGDDDEELKQRKIVELSN